MIALPVWIDTFATRKGHSVQAGIRPETTDENSVRSCLVEDEYGLAERTWTGTAIDVGAHVGGVTLALLADNPSLHVVVVEALPANVEVIRANLFRNGFEGRATVIEGAASCGSEPVEVAYGASDTDFAHLHRFIGGAVWQDSGPTVTVPAVSLTTLVERYGPISLVKIDCEGCEWSFLDDPAVSEVEEFRGEYHPRNGNGPARLRAMLEPTHVVTLDDAEPFGPFRAVRRG